MIVKDALPVPCPLLALIVALKVPVAVGVPLIKPVTGSALKPDGNWLAA